MKKIYAINKVIEETGSSLNCPTGMEGNNFNENSIAGNDIGVKEIKIDSKTGTAKDGSLRYQEFLPADTLLYSIVYFGNTQKDLTAKMIKEIVMDTINDFIQIGGDESLGKGICKIKWINGGE